MTGKQAYHLFQEQNYLPIYLQEWYLDIACSRGAWEVAYVEQDGIVLSIYIYFLKKKLNLAYVTMPTLVKYMGPLFSAHVKDEEKQALVDRMSLQIPKTEYFVQQWSPALYVDLKNKHVQTEFKARDTYVWNIGLSDKSLFELMDGNYRRAIQKNSVNIVANPPKNNTNKELLNSFVDLLESGMGPLKDHGLTKEQMIQLIFELESRNAGKLIALFNENELMSASIISWDSESAYYLFAANNKKFNKLYPGVQTAWYSKNFLQEKTNVKELDFLGSSIPTIAKVWKKLGAELHHYPLIEKNPSFLFSILGRMKNSWKSK